MSALASVADDPVAHFRHLIEVVVRERRAALRTIGGNFVIHIHDHATWTVISSGPRAGMHEGLLEEGVRFVLAATPEAVTAILEGRSETLEAALEDGALLLEGSFAVFERFLALLGGGQSMLALRCAR